MISKTKPASLLLLLHMMAAPPPRHEHKNDLYSRGLKVIIMVFKNIESRWRPLSWQGWAGNSREYQPQIPAPVLSGMKFFIPIPFPKSGNQVSFF